MSHHFDTPTAREDPRICVNDFYLFDGAAGTTVMAMTVNADASRLRGVRLDASRLRGVNRLADLATIWQQHWQCQPNAATMLLGEGR